MLYSGLLPVRARRRLFWLGLSLVAPVLVLCGTAGCKELSAKRPGKKDVALAQIDSTVITVAELEERINNQSPYVRARYAGLENKREFLDNIVKFEILAAEARRQGLDRDADVQRAMKQVMIQKLLKQRFEPLKETDITDADVQAYFDSHTEEFNRPPEVRVSMILVKDEATAKKVAGDPRTRGLENLGFRELVSEYSIDQPTKERGGDLRFFDAENRELPRELVDAAFTLINIGDVSPPVKTKNGYAILKLTGQRRALSRTLAEVTPQIRAKLFRERRQRLMDEFEDGLRKKTHVQVFAERLPEVRVDLTQNPLGAPDDLRPPPHSGQFHPAYQNAPQASPQRPGVPTVAPGLAPPASAPAGPPPSSAAGTASAPLPASPAQSNAGQ